MTQQEFFDRYSFSVRTDKIGGGSFGTVYKAYDNTRDREVAIKVSEVREMGGKEFSLRDEFKAIGKLPVHANIAHYEDVFTFESPQGVFDYAVMQYYKEGNLNSFLENHPELSFTEREGICMAILDGIAHLHMHKVVHRDLKPGNILVVKRKNGAIVPKITDFGLSKQAGTDSKASRFTNSFAGGTLMYSSPEQIRGEKLRLNTDLWSFGAIAFEVLTGKQLFQVDGYTSASAEWQNQMTQKILKADIGDKLKELPEKWRNTLLQCLQREHEQRVKSTDEIKDILLGLSASDINVTPEPKKVNPVNDDVTQVNPKTKDKEEYKPKKPTPSMAGTRPKPNEEKKWPYALALGVVAVVAGFGIWSFVANPFEDNIKENQISLFQKDGIYGYRIGDSTVIEPKYKLADKFIDGRAKVSTSDSIYYIDTSGKWIERFKTENQLSPNSEEIIAQTETQDESTEREDANDKPLEEEKKSSETNKNQDNSTTDKKEQNFTEDLDAIYKKAEHLYSQEKYAEAFPLLMKSASSGNPEAQHRLGWIYTNGLGNVTKDLKTGTSWYQKAADRGKASSINNLGNAYKNGDGVNVDYQKAKKLFQEAYQKGDNTAPRNIALLYQKGQGMPKSLEKALEWFNKAAEIGNVDALKNIGEAYFQGDGVDKDNYKAIEWYKKAAAQGESGAMIRIGQIYDIYLGADIDWNEARKWYEKAASKGNGVGLRNLGEFYLFGVGGVSKNKSTAINLFKKAANKGDKKSDFYLKIINEIETQKSFMVNESKNGNQLFLHNSTLQDYSTYPATISKYGNSWTLSIGYKLGSSKSVQIFPSHSAETNENFKKKYEDELPMVHSYTPCEVLYDLEGFHKSGVGLNYTKGYGSRSIGYIYYRAFFHEPNERVVLKTPAMICWKPKNEY